VAGRSLLFGAASAGKRAIGTDSSGIATAAAGGLTIARTDAPMSVAYGRASAARAITPNQNRWRRLPSPPKPSPRRAPSAPEVPDPAYASASRSRKQAPPVPNQAQKAWFGPPPTPQNESLQSMHPPRATVIAAYLRI
jgi:hypothetical protein